MPVGGKWNTIQTYQENVKPRVLVKPGAIVRPIEKPLV
jgi:U3 small nucleolar RNA-associated protein 14